jgi:hypothetical protein
MSTSVLAGRSGLKPRRKSRFPRWLWIVIACLAAVPAFYAIVFALYWPFTRQALIDLLQERSLRSVRIGKFHSTYFPPGCVAENIQFLHIRHKDRPPLITIQKLIVTTNYGAMIRFLRRLDNVRVIGLSVRVPVLEPAGEPSPIMPLTYSSSKSSMPIASLYADRASLEFDRIAPAPPYRILIESLVIHNLNSETPFTYTVRAHTSDPPGIITSSGAFGPWNPKNPATTPAHGSFSYTDANLASFKELSGTLDSNGRFAGTLARLTVSGSADVPDFMLKDTSHKRNLGVAYTANVDAIHGNLAFPRIIASFEHTVLDFDGSLSGSGAKLLDAEIVSSRARLEDLVDLFISGKQSPMSGNISFAAHVHMPLATEPFLKGLLLNGSFGVTRSLFSDRQLEQGLARLSRSTKAGKRATEETSDPETVISDLKGTVHARDGIAHLSHVEFEIPGAHAWIDGTYSLLNYNTDLTGVLITKGDVADTQTGVKSVLLKIITPFFRRTHRNAKIVPFKISGPYGHTSVSLDLGREQQ